MNKCLKLGNGTLTQTELFNVLQEGCRENKLLFEEEQLDSLTQILWEEAVGNKTSMSLQDLKDEVLKYPGLAQGLCKKYKLYIHVLNYYIKILEF